MGPFLLVLLGITLSIISYGLGQWYERRMWRRMLGGPKWPQSGVEERKTHADALTEQRWKTEILGTFPDAEHEPCKNCGSTTYAWRTTLTDIRCSDCRDFGLVKDVPPEMDPPTLRDTGFTDPPSLR